MILVSGGMYVTKQDLRRQRQFLSQNPLQPVLLPSGEIDYTALVAKFYASLNEFAYRFVGDPLASMFRSRSEDDSEDEFESERINHGEEIVNTPIKECIDVLIQSMNNERRKGDGADKEVLKKGFSYLVGFAYDIASRCENFLEGIRRPEDGRIELDSEFMKGLCRDLLNEAKLLKKMNVTVEGGTVSKLYTLGEPFAKVGKVLWQKKKRRAKPSPETPAAKESINAPDSTQPVEESMAQLKV